METFSPAEARHWGTDPFWSESYNKLEEIRRQGTIELDLNVIEKDIFDGDSIAYKLMEAMASVWQQESWDGFKGAPRV